MLKRVLILFLVCGIVLSLGTFASAQNLRGVWVDTKSIPRTPEEIANMVDQLHHVGFNTIFLESFYHGETIYPSSLLASLGLPKQQKLFAEAGYDPLEVFLSEAHKRSMQVHAWVHIFYISLDEAGEILNLYPHWAVVSKEGKPGYQSGNHFFFWLCPMEKEIWDFYLNLFSEMAEKYPVDGIHFDYCRFPEFTLADTCYAQAHRQNFFASYGLDPITLSPLENPTAYKQWIQFRTEQLTEFVRYLTSNLKNRFPTLLLSCAIKPLGFPLGLYPGALQDWPTWGKEKLFDFLVAMTYTSRPGEFEGMVHWVGTFLEGTPFAAGVWAFNQKTETILEEIKRALYYPLTGIVIFAYPYLSKETLHALTQEFLSGNCSPMKAFLSLSFYQVNHRSAHVFFTQEAVTVDGILSETSWKRADWQNNFITITGEPSRYSTSFTLLYDEENLYCAFKLGLLTPTQPRFREHDSPVFYEPSVEIFIDPFANSGIWYQIAINYNGTVYDSFSLTGSRFNGNWKVAVHKDSNDTLYIEIALPFQELGKRPEKGEIWGANFCRNEPEKDEFSVFSPVPGLYAAPTLLGNIIFGK
ncbi:family 10 glycosylhydrolase [Atrimonas thermophila]|uniref:family 10 glycosylhydrolase n=1 Tax=Atrimonas thermophila TaxID=3064161 RepID=UPI00399C503E